MVRGLHGFQGACGVCRGLKPLLAIQSACDMADDWAPSLGYSSTSYSACDLKINVGSKVCLKAHLTNYDVPEADAEAFSADFMAVRTACLAFETKDTCVAAAPAEAMTLSARVETVNANTSGSFGLMPPAFALLALAAALLVV